jgi:hypothetical protein
LESIFGGNWHCLGLVWRVFLPGIGYDKSLFEKLLTVSGSEKVCFEKEFRQTLALARSGF